MSKQSKMRRAAEKAIQRTMVKRTEHLRAYAPALLAAVELALGTMTDSGATKDEVERTIAQLRMVAYNASSEGNHIPPNLRIICEDGGVVRVESDAPDVVDRMYPDIEIIDFDTGELDVQELTVVRKEKNGHMLEALVYTPMIEKISVSVA